MGTSLGFRHNAAVVLVWLLATVSLGGQRFWDTTTAIDLRAQAVSEEMTWSRNLTRTADGLDTGPASGTAIPEFWLQTPPLATGPSWGPPDNVTVSMTLDDLEMVETTMRASLAVFARYSADRVHWSSWFPVPATSRETFHGSHVLPRTAQERRNALLQEWGRTEPVWSSDQHEFFLWVAAEHPDFFETEIPVVGYVQLRVEGLAQSFRAAGITVRLQAGMSGLSAVPRGPVRPDAESPWFFDLSRVDASRTGTAAAPGR
jgi:hypothetical protein